MKVKSPALFLLAALQLLPAAAFCAASSLGRSAAINRLVTPNGDRKNDTFIFRCYNPRDYAVEGSIFDLSGREIGVMTLKQRYNGATASASATGEFYDFEWNPNAGGHSPGGVYVYEVRQETKVYKGTIVVIR